MIGDLMILPANISIESYAICILHVFSASLDGVVATGRYGMKINLADALLAKISD